MTAIADQMTVQIDYTLTVDGAVVDSSAGKAPLSYRHGAHQIIPGLERQLTGLHAGDERDFVIAPDEAYGDIDPEGLMEVPRDQLPAGTKPELGLTLRGEDQQGQSFRARIVGVKDDSVTLNLNHPLAGKTLYFKVKVISVTPTAS